MGNYDELDLENLSMPSCFLDPKALAEIKKPGDGRSYDEIMASRPKYNTLMKIINTDIYDSRLVSGMGTAIIKMRRMQFDRMKSLFGFSNDHECYEWLASHGRQDSEAGEKLVADALLTGAWEELPDLLQCAYHAIKAGVL